MGTWRNKSMHIYIHRYMLNKAYHPFLFLSPWMYSFCDANRSTYRRTQTTRTNFWRVERKWHGLGGVRCIGYTYKIVWTSFIWEFNGNVLLLYTCNLCYILRHSETPVVLRLANSNNNASDNIMLFVRFKDESYVSLGMNLFIEQILLAWLLLIHLCVSKDIIHSCLDLSLMISSACATGRVEHESSNLNTRPVQFVWKLIDHDRLKELPYFKRVVKTLS